MNLYFAHPITTKTLVSQIRKTDILRLIKERYPQIILIDPSVYDLDDAVDHEEIVRRNMFDILNSDGVFADFSVPSSGVAMEAAYARFIGKKVVGLSSVRPSAWVTHVCDMTSSTVDGAVMAIGHVFSGKTQK